MSRMSARGYVMSLLCGLIVVMGSGCGDDASENAQICTEEFSGDECTVFEMVNQERAQEGMPALRFDVTLARAARDHATDMIQRKYFSHESPDGGKFSERAKASGYEGFPRGENIAYGQQTPQDVMESWMNSEGHRRNIMDAQATAIGVGLDGTHWVQVFGVD